MSRAFVDADCESGCAVRIGDEITLEIVRVVGNQVRIGIRAPATVKILRRELLKPNETGADTSAPVVD